MIVADDGSKDQTVAMLEELGLVNLHVLKAQKNGGKGSAVRRGMLAARGKYVLFTDADNSTPIENITPVLTKLATESYDVAVGSRAAEGASEGNKSALRQFLSDSLRMMVRVVLGIQVKDTQCGFKMYTQEAAKRLHGAQTIDGFSFDLEVLYLAGKVGYRIAEVPVQWMDAPGSKVDARKEAVRFLRDMSLIRRNDLQGLYEESLKRSVSANPKVKAFSIALVTAYPPSSGSVKESAFHVVEALRHKPDVERLYILSDYLPDGTTYPTFADDLVPTEIIPCWRFDDLQTAFQLGQTIRNIKPNVVLYNIQFASFGSNRLTGAIGLLSPLLTRTLNHIPVVVLLHNIMETIDLNSAGFGGNPLMISITRFAGNLFTRALLQADLVALTIPKYVEIIREKYGVQHAILAPHGAFGELPMPTFSHDNSQPLQVMTFGKFGTYKRVELLIEAFAKLLEEYPTLELVIAGTDNPNAKGYLENARQTYQHVPNIRFTGYVAEEDVAPLFLRSDVVVFPYVSTTGSSGVLHQAGGYGRAVVLPHLGDFAELITEEGYVGEFFDPSSVESLAQAINLLLSDPAKREQQGQHNYLAARGVPISDVVDWHLMHMRSLIEKGV